MNNEKITTLTDELTRSAELLDWAADEIERLRRANDEMVLDSGILFANEGDAMEFFNGLLARGQSGEINSDGPNMLERLRQEVSELEKETKRLQQQRMKAKARKDQADTLPDLPIYGWSQRAQSEEERRERNKLEENSQQQRLQRQVEIEQARIDFEYAHQLYIESSYKLDRRRMELAHLERRVDQFSALLRCAEARK
jgi:hypothetical protein